ncbi:ribonuclease HI family protein [Janthinobacterium aquaticum]|uniref:ribonuclease HI family protein n=1 Tax=Janthinobacterium sp. FT58W TaxID=2654254 RepID=UPI001D031B34|nr:ribonuclease HI family protein [Janthinobacterium sp. FT58W]
MASENTLHKAQLRRERKAAAEQAPPLAWHGWFDGSAHPNPGKMGIGALLLGPNGERVEISLAAGYGDSSEAEYAALAALLQAALQVQPAQLLLHGDSQVVINDVLGVTRRPAKGLETQRAAVHALLAQLPGASLHWVPRHRNGEADRLSQAAIALEGRTGPDSHAAGDGGA